MSNLHSSDGGARIQVLAQLKAPAVANLKMQSVWLQHQSKINYIYIIYIYIYMMIYNINPVYMYNIRLYQMLIGVK